MTSTTVPRGTAARWIWNEAWPKWDAEIDEVIEEGRDQVLIIARVFGEGAASGIRLDEWGAALHLPRRTDPAHRGRD